MSRFGLLAILCAVGGLCACAPPPPTAAFQEPLDALERSRSAETTAALRYAGVAEGSYFALNGHYTASLADLQAEGLRVSGAVTLTVEATATGYCIVAEHTRMKAGNEWQTATLSSSGQGPTASDTCS